MSLVPPILISPAVSAPDPRVQTRVSSSLKPATAVKPPRFGQMDPAWMLGEGVMMGLGMTLGQSLFPPLREGLAHAWQRATRFITKKP
jgi:hypothetical protein